MAIQRLRKYLSINRPESWGYRRQLIANRAIYFSDPSNFNDPLDCNIAAAARLRHALYDCWVFCLSLDSCNDFLMFAHYADGHRGFRLTFEIDTSQTIGDIGVLGRGREVTYVPELPSDFDLNNIHMSLFTKLDCWSYEAEYRILAVTTDALTYGTSSLVEVAFGCRLNVDFEPVIRNWVREGNHERVRFVRARFCDSPSGYEYIGA
jgi:hypothetical protein